jgi:uncharacterized RDD family membrane protein YckC
VRLDRLALGPAERALDAALAGPLPEALGRSLAEHKVLERVATELLEAAAADGDGIDEVAARIEGSEAGRLVEAYIARLAESEAVRATLTEVMSGPEVRQALTRQTTSWAAELAAAARRRARKLDDSIQVGAVPESYGGLASRGAGLVIDAALAQLAFLVVTGTIALVAGLTGGIQTGWLAGTLAGGGWLLVAGTYFVAFWSTGGQTPGMRVMGVRVITRSTETPSVARSIVRFAGLLLAIIPLFLGFLPVPFDAQRRALPDFIAGTVVLCVPDEAG